MGDKAKKRRRGRRREKAFDPPADAPASTPAEPRFDPPANEDKEQAHAAGAMASDDESGKEGVVQDDLFGVSPGPLDRRSRERTDVGKQPSPRTKDTPAEPSGTDDFAESPTLYDDLGDQRTRITLPDESPTVIPDFSEQKTLVTMQPRRPEEKGWAIVRAFFRGLLRVVLAGLQLVATTILVFGLVGAASYLILKEYVGGREVKVPNVCGVTLDEALVKLKPYGLLIELERREYSDAVPAGSIVAQSPSPEINVKLRTPVRVVLSDGAERVRVRSVVGENEIKAGVLLRSEPDADLDVGERAYAYSSFAAKGDVIAQDPPPGTPVLRGRRIHLLVSLGPLPVYYEMPDLRDKTLQEARIALGAMQLTITAIRERDLPGTRHGIVIAQDPRPGQRVARDNPIVVTTATGLGGTLVP